MQHKKCFKMKQVCIQMNVIFSPEMETSRWISSHMWALTYSASLLVFFPVPKNGCSVTLEARHCMLRRAFQGSHVVLNGAHLQVFFFKKTKSQCLAATLMSPHDDLLLMLDLSLMQHASLTWT